MGNFQRVFLRWLSEVWDWWWFDFQSKNCWPGLFVQLASLGPPMVAAAYRVFESVPTDFVQLAPVVVVPLHELFHHSPQQVGLDFAGEAFIIAGRLRLRRWWRMLYQLVLRLYIIWSGVASNPVDILLPEELDIGGSLLLYHQIPFGFAAMFWFAVQYPFVKFWGNLWNDCKCNFTWSSDAVPSIEPW